MSGNNNPLRELKGTPTAVTPTPAAAEAEVMAAIQSRLTAVETLGRGMREVEAHMDAIGKQVKTIGNSVDDIGKQVKTIGSNADDIGKQVTELEAARAKLRQDVDSLLAAHDMAEEAKRQGAKTKKPGRVLSATWYSQNKYVRYGTRTVVVAAAGAALYYGGRAGVRRYKAWKAAKASALDMTGADFAQ